MIKIILYFCKKNLKSKAMKMKKTNQELNTFIDIANRIPIGDENTKFVNVLNKQMKIFNSALEKYNSDLEDLRIDNCSVDERGNVKYEVINGLKEYVFSKDALKILTIGHRKILNTEVEVEVILKEEHLDKCHPQYIGWYKYFLEIDDVLDTNSGASK
jgi:hypothetical protein